MPIYDYTCEHCGRTFELLVRATTVEACPHCGCERLQRLISAPIAPGKRRNRGSRTRARRARRPHDEL